MNPNPSHSEGVVRARHQAARAIPSLGVAVIGLAVILGLLWWVHPTFAPVESWTPLGAAWAGGIILTLAGALACGWARRRTLLRSAAELDAVLLSHNRLETVTALRGVQSPLARAQREETERFLQASRLAPRRRALTVLVVLVFGMALAHLALLACWIRPAPPDLAATHDASSAGADGKPALPTASLEWQSPECETTATAIEEVPLEAEARSTTGLRGVVLEVEVNGEHRLSQPLANPSIPPGRQTLQASIYLDQLRVNAYDVVSYHLRAQRTWSPPLPPTVSPVQFVQVKPMRQDTLVCAGGDRPSQCFNYVSALKVAQLRLLKQNFILAHAEIGRTSDEWRRENNRVAGDQCQLAKRAEEVIQLMVSNHYPAQILGLVRQARPLMIEAGDRMVSEENQPALEPQGKALGLLTAVEKYLENILRLAGQSVRPGADDPFRKARNLDLKTHPLTRAGKLDALAAEQSRLAGELAAGGTNTTLRLAAEEAKPGADDIAGSLGERQGKIERSIEELLDEPGWDPDALKHLQSSDELAGEAREEIARHDLVAAREPAAEAARELRQTASALRAGGNESAKNHLADALLRLSAAAEAVRKAPQAKSGGEASAELTKSEEAVRETARRLEEESQRQQANGTTNLAERLGALAAELRSETITHLQAQAQESPRDAGRSEALAQRLDELAERAAQLRNPSPPTRQELARLLERMQRTQANLRNLASQCSGPRAAPSARAGGQGQGAASAGRAIGNQPPLSSQPEGRAGPAPSGASSQGAVTVGQIEEAGRDEQWQQHRDNLVGELNEQALDAMAIQPEAAELRQVRELLRRGAGGLAGDDQVVAFVAELDPPLSGLILLLRQELALFRRPYTLTDPQVAQAPPAYQAAVADYFEQLSRDYAANPPDAGTNE
ncbi:MAG: hypothetical protein MUE94_05060 [Verrucomicrobia bacterium]|jgi:hypothetical protein|nr:hypothetical protein [Verrucomicrobiota bacterium]